MCAICGRSGYLLKPAHSRKPCLLSSKEVRTFLTLLSVQPQRFQARYVKWGLLKAERHRPVLHKACTGYICRYGNEESFCQKHHSCKLQNGGKYIWRSNDNEFHIQTSHSPLEPIRRGTLSGAASREALASFLRVSVYAVCRGNLLETNPTSLWFYDLALESTQLPLNGARTASYHG
jgi:hypothetical protein